MKTMTLKMLTTVCAMLIITPASSHAQRGPQRGPNLPNTSNRANLSKKIKKIKSEKFNAKMYAAFKHERCTNCHQMSDTQSAIYQRHLSENRITATTDVTDANSCNGCHKRAEIVNADWHAPAARFDYTNLLNKPHALCKKVKANMRHAAHQKKMDLHLLEDKLILWAVSNGKVPNLTTGATDQRAKAPPGSLGAWRTAVRNWKRSGFDCGLGPLQHKKTKKKKAKKRRRRR